MLPARVPSCVDAAVESSWRSIPATGVYKDCTKKSNFERREARGSYLVGNHLQVDRRSLHYSWPVTEWHEKDTDSSSRSKAVMIGEEKEFV